MYVLDHKLDKKLHNIRDQLLSEFLTYLGNFYNKITQNKRDLARNAIGCFVRNTFYSYSRGKLTKGVTLDQSNYSKPTLVNGRDTKRRISYTYTRSLFDFLKMKDYINLKVGGAVDYGFVDGKWSAVETEPSYVTLLPKLINLYEKCTDVPVLQRDNVILVRDDHKNDISFRMTPHLRERREMLDRFNELSLHTEVENKSGKYDVQMYKVYNDKTKMRGGRSYMSGSGIQHLTKKQRRELTISGKKTVIYDFQSFEPSIAYSMCGELMPEDPYQIELKGYDSKTLRNICKSFLLVMMNLKDANTVVPVCNHVLFKDFKVESLSKKGLVPERIETNRIIDKLSDKNYLILQTFYANPDYDIPQAGSLITDYVVDYFAQRGILVLPVFDEFIIDADYEEDLVRVMGNAYEFVMGSKDNCRIRKEK